MTSRELCARCLIKMDTREGYSNLVLDAALKDCKLDQRDKAFASLLFYGVLERRITLDACLAPLCSTKLKKLAPAVRSVLQIAVYELLYTQTPAAAAVSQAVNTVRALGQPRAAGLVNGVLRSFLRSECKIPVPSSPQSARLSVENSVAEPLVRLLVKHYGTAATQRFLQCSGGPAPVYLRVNPTRTTAEELVSALAQEGVEAAPVEGIPGALVLTVGTGGDLRRLRAFEQGLFHVQDLASQLCVLALDPRPGMDVLDVCAAPGGKTFSAAGLMENKGRILANDLHPQRAELIAQGAKRLGFDCVRATSGDATLHRSELGLFQRVLCDVPCSGIGVLRRKPEIRYKDPADFADLPEIQHKILEASAKYVAEEGLLVYSTCTLNPAENQQVIEAFLANHPDWQPGRLPAPLGQGWHTTLMDTPWNCDGFFISVVERKKP
ncbi:MAG: 16S rRNA (cytosine(967)-C(5))-methyltransferase RsmB [Oscillospiraceae bacterium]|nr:16S rRNA (cytosine(967)-C(5))-methyltransferase RsmB [Oscillospiraceae bacterium]